MNKILASLSDKFHNIKAYIHNRWVAKTHCLTASRSDIKKGSWCDVGDRFLPCLFNELVDFVEVEKASHQAWSSDKHKYGYSNWKAFLGAWRSPQAGIDYLLWESSLTDDELTGSGNSALSKQALLAKEVLDLYVWWTIKYRARPDSAVASGWSKFCRDYPLSSRTLLDWNDDPVTAKKSVDIINAMDAIDKKYADEDEEMMIRLIKIRGSLWT